MSGIIQFSFGILALLLLLRAALSTPFPIREALLAYCIFILSEIIGDMRK